MNIVFQAHSGLRWLILLGVVLILVKSLVGLFGSGQYSKFDKILGSATVGFMDIQFLLGIVLYFAYSPYTMKFSFNLNNDSERFWAVEHLVLMILAIVAAHIGKSIARKSDDSIVQFRFQAIFFAITLLLLIMGIPWDRV